MVCWGIDRPHRIQSLGHRLYPQYRPYSHHDPSRFEVLKSSLFLHGDSCRQRQGIHRHHRRSPRPYLGNRRHPCPK